TDILGMAAGARLLSGGARWLAAQSLLLCLAALPFTGVSFWPALLIAAAALAYRWLRTRVARRQASQT
ncbi:MAG TPA: hypothetical protein VFX31_07485, partial [Ktedonobacterales bacterium]|nr:hypothetical protein [Ktedonobacterales bacterium]